MDTLVGCIIHGYLTALAVFDFFFPVAIELPDSLPTFIRYEKLGVAPINGLQHLPDSTPAELLIITAPHEPTIGEPADEPSLTELPFIDNEDGAVGADSGLPANHLVHNKGLEPQVPYLREQEGRKHRWGMLTGNNLRFDD